MDGLAPYIDIFLKNRKYVYRDTWDVFKISKKGLLSEMYN